MQGGRKTKGAVSIFLVIILVPALAVSSLFVDASKLELARGVAASAGDLTMNTALTDYDTMLKDMYGLFATAQDTEELFSRLEEYYRTCITSSGVSEQDADDYVDQIMAQLGLVASDDQTADILNMELVDFDITKNSDASLANAAILEKQMVDFMKYRAPINTGLSFITALQNFGTLSKQTELVDKRQTYYQAESDVMTEAQKAWFHINQYNKSGLVTTDAYLTGMKSSFNGYQDNYQTIAAKIIKDLYDTQDYDDFTNYSYSIVKEEVELGDGTKEQVPIFYTDSGMRVKKTVYTEYTTYSTGSPATAGNIKTALFAFNSACNAFKTAENNLLDYDSNTYGLQYLVQTNRDNLYYTWVQAAAGMYDKYSALRHAVAYAGQTTDGNSVMSTSEQLFGASYARSYSDYYNQFLSDFDACTAGFNDKRAQYSRTLQGYANNADTSTTDIENQIAAIYSQIAGYRTTVSDAKTNLEEAVTCLESVYNDVKAGGTLEKRKEEWKQVADDDDLSNTSMGKQDLAEIDNLSTYLNADEVQKLIVRLNTVAGHLQNLLDQIDSYTFFDTKIIEISDYATFKNLLKTKIGDGNLKSVPIDTSELNNQVAAWTNDKFVVGNAVDVSWENQSGSQPNLIKDKPNFYSYLYSHFYTASESTEDTGEAEASKELYDSFKSTTSETAGADADSAKGGNLEGGNELNALANRPSLKAASQAGSPSTDVTTGDDAAKNTSAGLSSMFGNLSSAVLNMGTDLRDKLYVSDYILSMFSYDTIEKEYAVEHTGEEVNIQSMTLVPIDATKNYAYGREVEYVIYGGSNAENVAKAYASIYGIRLGFNLIYAFSDSAIRDTAFAIATPISAATLGVIPVPLIQAAIIIGVACCESALDLNNLKDGESVPLFKNSQTWQCSIKNVITEVKAEVGDLLQEVGTSAADLTVKELNSLLDKTDAELDEYIAENLNAVTSTVSASYDTLITRHANTAIQKLTTLCNNAIEEKRLHSDSNMVEMVSEGLDSWLAEEAAKVDTSSDLSYIVKKEAVEIIKKDYIPAVLEALEGVAENAEAAVAETANEIMSIIDWIRIDITYKIIDTSSAVSKYKSDMTNEIKASLAEGAESFKNTLNNKLGGVFGDSSGSGSDATGMASLLSFSYSDYLRLFLMIGLYTNEEGVLLRTADAIQANMGLTTGEEGYDLANSCVYVELSATIQVKPTLLALPLFADVEGNPATDQNWYTITHDSIKGY